MQLVGRMRESNIGNTVTIIQVIKIAFPVHRTVSQRCTIRAIYTGRTQLRYTHGS